MGMIMKRHFHKYSSLFPSCLVLLALLTGCMEQVRDNLGDSGSAADQGSGGDNGGVADGGGTGGNNGGSTGNGDGIISPLIEMVNLKGGDFVPGGKTFSIFYIVTDEALGFNESKVEYQREGDTDWVLIQDKVVSTSGDEIVVNWDVCPQPGKVECDTHRDGPGYKIRITAYGKNGLTTEAISDAPFTIDSTAPQLANNGFSVVPGSPANGFVQFNLAGASDSLTPVAAVCVKTDSAMPVTSDPCWLRAEALGVSEQMTLPTVTITKYVGFTDASYSYYVWVKDKAGNMATMTSTNNLDKVDVVYVAPTYSSTNGFWNDTIDASFAFSTDASASSAKNYSTNPANNLQTMSDPGTLVVNSKGEAFIKDRTSGIIKINLLTHTRETIIPIAGAITEGAVGAAGAARLKNPVRIALDRDDALWILDEAHLAYVDFSQATPSLQIVAGGGALVDDTLTDPLQLKITYHDNLRWYGTFSVLPNKWVIFHSDDPHAKLIPAAGTPMKLRIYKHSADPAQRSITTLTLSGSYGSSTVDDLYPYGPMTITYDPDRARIKSIYGRFCRENIAGTSCDETVVLRFNSTGMSDQSIAIQTSVSNEPLFNLEETVFSFNSNRGFFTSYDANTNNWNKWVGGLSLGTSFCSNGTPGTSCRLRLVDVFVDQGKQIYFFDDTRLRTVDFDGSVQTLYEP